MTSTRPETVSLGSVLTIKKLYTICNHIVEKSENISIEAINLNQEEFQKKYSDWEIQKFTSHEIVLYKEIKDYCGEHYSLKDINGYIGIYKLDKNDNEAELVKVTNISTEYLPETDLIKMKNGIKVYTDKELNKMLEDFE